MTSAARARWLSGLGTAVIGVPDPAATSAFLADGLDFTILPGADGIRVACAGSYGADEPQVAIELVEAAQLALLELRFTAVDGCDLAALERAVIEHGGVLLPNGSGPCVRFSDPNGVPVACGPSAPSGTGALPASGLRPRRLGHANVKVPDAMAGTRFWVRALGMSLSEQIGEDLTFLRLGAEHHDLGLRTGDRAALHHLGFEVPGWDAYRSILDHLADAGHHVEFGPGRHGVGRNLFVYLRDPSSGLRIELFADMASVGAQADPEVAPIRWRPEDRLSRTLNRWGSAPPPPSFLE